MKSKKLYGLFILLIAISLWIIAFYSYPLFKKLNLFLLGNPPASVAPENVVMRLKILFATTFAFFPLMVAFVNIVFQAKRKYSYLIYLSMSISMLVFYTVRMYNVHLLLVEQKERLGNNIIMQLPLAQMQIESFVFVGAMIGAIVGAIFMKRFQKKGKI